MNFDWLVIMICTFWNFKELIQELNQHVGIIHRVLLFNSSIFPTINNQSLIMWLEFVLGFSSPKIEKSKSLRFAKKINQFLEKSIVSFDVRLCKYNENSLFWNENWNSGGLNEFENILKNKFWTSVFYLRWKIVQAIWLRNWVIEDWCKCCALMHVLTCVSYRYLSCVPAAHMVYPIFCTEWCISQL